MVHVRLNSSVLTVATLLLIVFTISELYLWRSQPSPSSGSVASTQQLLQSKGKVHVLLVSSWRSGSSFLGQVFSQHPSVFYLMEPAWHVWKKMRMLGALEQRMAVRDLLRQVLQCDMTVMESYMGAWAKTNHLFFWSSSRALCSPPVCSLTAHGDMSNQSECQKHCEGKSLDLAGEACQTYSHVVLKTVRVFDLESLYPLLRDPTLDLRIVHLVRDPRAVWRSRRWVNKILAEDTKIVLQHSDVQGLEADVSIMDTICRSHVRFHQTVRNKAPEFLHGRYQMVRYEDVANDPIRQVEKIYRFTGLNMTEQLRSWIRNSTQKKSAHTDPFKTMSRNAKDVSLAWRTSLPHSEVQRVQEVCKYAMYLYGYRLVASDKDQRNLDQDVVLPLRPIKDSIKDQNSVS